MPVEIIAKLLEEDKLSLKEIRNFYNGSHFEKLLRPKIWESLFGKNDNFNFDEIYDLPFQTNLREKCANLINPNPNVKNISEIESLLTYYIKTNDICDISSFDESWAPILSMLCQMNYTTPVLYSCFTSIIKKYIPNNLNLFYDTFRILLLYHDPELYSFLESKKLHPREYCTSWFSTLYASCNCDEEVKYALWDFIFQQDSFILLCMALIFLINAKEALIELENNDKSEIINIIVNMPSKMNEEDLPDFRSLCQFYSLTTPITLKKEFNVLFNMYKDEFAPLLTLRISAEELILSKNHKNKDAECLSYFLVDCRPAEQYNHGHHPTAFHLDASLMLQDANKFENAILALMAAKKNSLKIKSTAAGSHICLMGTGNISASKDSSNNLIALNGNDIPNHLETIDSNDQIINMVASHFLRKHYKYVSILENGYVDLHETLKSDLNHNLTLHDAQRCLVCIATKNPLSQNLRAASPSDDNFSRQKLQNEENDPFNFLGKFSSVMRLKTKEMKQKLSNYIVNANNLSGSEKGISPLSLHNKQYRNRPAIFAITDEDDDDDEDEDISRLKGGYEEGMSAGGRYLGNDSKLLYLTQAEWAAKLDSLQTFPCYHLLKSTNYPSLLMVTDSHIYVLKKCDSRANDGSHSKLFSLSKESASAPADYAHKGNTDDKFICSFSRPLSAIVKITSRRNNPEIITFKYGRVQVFPNKSSPPPSRDSADSYESVNKHSPRKSLERDIEENCIIEVDAMDKFYIPNLAGDATKLVKRIIVEQIEASSATISDEPPTNQQLDDE